ncbi:hypothetical protein ACHAPF_002421 [Botrytis cinerea]
MADDTQDESANTPIASAVPPKKYPKGVILGKDGKPPPRPPPQPTAPPPSKPSAAPPGPSYTRSRPPTPAPPPPATAPTYRPS